MDRFGRRVGALIGLAIGDAVGWPAVRHRAQLLPPWTRRLHRELDAFAEVQQVTTMPVPFALNQPTAPLRLGPSDDAEWVAWTLTWLRAADGPIGRDDVHARWRSAVADGTLPRGRISVATAADTLRRDVDPPRTGHDNPHHFDDAAAVRAVAAGIVAADPVQAATLAGWDAEVTNAGDGLAAATAMAQTISRLVAGESVTTAWATAAVSLPAGGLLAGTVAQALEATRDVPSPAEAVPLLADLVDHVYSYGVAAAQTMPVAVALAHVTERGGARPIDAVTAAACLPTLADSAPALTGALVGAGAGITALPTTWMERCRRLAGCCAPGLAGTDLVDLATGLDERTIRDQ
ncbi:hypothetical protein E1269_25505 [Jiangella asiatica]|uniref:ADP-ribosylglycohydrolase family protein n=1 Tax=Jiangella asiatica TaxID=2530372 RepID=A0A4V2Z0C4_9ACTN|nr:hypothetical protein E1269_25505 [Jiangella asiatica]